MTRGGARGINGCSAKFSRGGALAASCTDTAFGTTINAVTVTALGVSAADPPKLHNAQWPWAACGDAGAGASLSCVVQMTPITSASFANTVTRASAEEAGSNAANSTAHSAISADSFWRRRENMARLSARFARSRKRMVYGHEKVP